MMIIKKFFIVKNIKIPLNTYFNFFAFNLIISLCFKIKNNMFVQKPKRLCNNFYFPDNKC
jgi:hypothetical protein